MWCRMRQSYLGAEFVDNTLIIERIDAFLTKHKGQNFTAEEIAKRINEENWSGGLSCLASMDLQFHRKDLNNSPDQPNATPLFTSRVC